MYDSVNISIIEQIVTPEPRGGRPPNPDPPHHDFYRRLQSDMADLRERLGGLPSPGEAAGIWRGIWHRDAHHSTAIEGNPLGFTQVERLLTEGRAVGDGKLRDYLEVRGYAAAAEWVYRQAVRREGLCHPDALLSLTEVRQVHHTALSPVWEVAPHPDATDLESPGSFRRHDIRPFPGGMTPVSWPLVPAEMDAWIDLVNQLDPAALHFPEHLADLHCRFERTHPFLDGNGRTGRLLANLVLIRLGYPPAIIYKRERPRYLDALRKADRGEPGALGEMFARAILDNLYRFVLPAVAGPDGLVPLSALATPDLKGPALRAAAGRGRLRAVRNASGRWRSCRAWVDAYRANRYRRDRE